MISLLAKLLILLLLLKETIESIKEKKGITTTNILIINASYIHILHVNIS